MFRPKGFQRTRQIPEEPAHLFQCPFCNAILNIKQNLNHLNDHHPSIQSKEKIVYLQTILNRVEYRDTNHPLRREWRRAHGLLEL